MPRKLLYDEIHEWVGGVATNARPDDLKALNAFPRGKNCQLLNVGSNSAVPSTRPGCTLMNTAKMTGGTAITWQGDYRPTGPGSSRHLVINATGRLQQMNDTNGTLTDFDTGTPIPFSTNVYPDSVQANALMFIVNGVENKKLTIIGGNGKVQGMGIVAPALPAVALGGGGTPNGTYDFGVTYYNNLTGQESSLSPLNTIVAAGNVINVTLVASGDAQVTTIRIYIRKGTLSGGIFRCVVGTTPAVNADGGFSNTNQTVVVNISDAQINALTILAPTATENNPPPILDRITFHQGRLFGVPQASNSTLVFSKTTSEGMESFDPTFTIPVGKDDGDRIMAIESAHEQLVILKNRSIYILVGTFPNWELRIITNQFGCVSHMSIITVNDVTYFWTSFGPASYSPGNSPLLLAQPNNANIVSSDNINFNVLDKIVVGLDEVGLRLLWSIPVLATNRNNILLPYSLRLGVFESDGWQMLDFSSLERVFDATGQPKLYMGDYIGKIFRLETQLGKPDFPINQNLFTDGAAGGTLGNRNLTSATSTTLTDLIGGGFFDTGDQLQQQYVYVRDANGQNLQRKRIGSNTATTLTLDAGEAFNPVPDSTWTYNISSPNFEFDFGWSSMGLGMWKKRFEQFFLETSGVSGKTAAVDMFTNLNPHFGTNPERTATFSIDTTTLKPIRTSLRVGLVGRSYLMRVRVGTANSPISIFRMALRAEPLTDKS